MISNTSRSVFTLDGRVVNLETGVLASTVRMEIDDDARGGYDERSWMRVIAVKPQSFPVYSADLQSSNTNALYILFHFDRIKRRHLPRGNRLRTLDAPPASIGRNGSVFSSRI